MLKIVSLGGSIVAPKGVDTEFVEAFVLRVTEYLQEDGQRRLILIVGGGAPAREYQRAYRAMVGDDANSEDQDWIGIMATRLNAELVRAMFHRAGFCMDPVVTDPTADIAFTGRVLIAAGWKPGFSTDFDAVKLAERFSGSTVINLSNIEQVYTADPKIDPSAKPLAAVTWEDFSKLVGEDWCPGSNLPFDPVATKRARQLGLTVITAGGKDLANIEKILRGQEFFGTRIGG